MHMFSDEREQTILTLLDNHTEGLSIEEIAAHINTSRQTCARILDRMIARDQIVRREVGIAKLHYLKKHYTPEATT